MYIDKYPFCFSTIRYHSFNLNEEFINFMVKECYWQNGFQFCESRYKIEEKNPFEVKAAKDYIIDNSISLEVSEANSPDDLSLVGTIGSYTYDSTNKVGIASLGDDGGNIRVQIAVPEATYTFRDGYYRAEMVLTNNSSNPDAYVRTQFICGCDNFTLPERVYGGKSKIIEYYFYYDSSVSTCPSAPANNNNILITIKGYDGMKENDEIIVSTFKFYEMTPN